MLQGILIDALQNFVVIDKFMSTERSSYTLANALRFKPAFDKALEDGVNVNIPLADSGYTLGTLKHRCAEALLFMCREWDNDSMPESRYKKEDYQRLRGSTKISFIPPEENLPGIMINFKRAKDKDALKFMISNTLPTINSAKAAAETKKWKDQVMNFITGESLVLNLTGLTLNTEEQMWAKEQLSKAGLEHIVSDKIVRATK